MSTGGMSTVGDLPVVVFDHLNRLTDDRGLFEHAKLTVVRPEHGYCVDDAARGLVVLCREPEASPTVRRLARCYLDFVLEAVQPDGACRNRMSVAGEWTDEPGLGDWWGRALWGLGAAAAQAHSPGMRARALAGFRVAAQRRSPDLRGLAFAALGAALLGGRTEPAATMILRDLIAAVGESATDPAWPWPEPRLGYGNASVAEALIVAGEQLADPAALSHGLRLLEFLLATETRDGHLSVTPVGGRGLEETDAGFDQQPIEVAALADACATAYRLTGQPQWLDAVRQAWSWFSGDNDSATPMFDPRTGGGYDGLERQGRNANQGAESTLAMLGTAQQQRRLSTAR